MGAKKIEELAPRNQQVYIFDGKNDAADTRLVVPKPVRWRFYPAGSKLKV
jgi:hypothetical protein